MKSLSPLLVFSLAHIRLAAAVTCFTSMGFLAGCKTTGSAVQASTGANGPATQAMSAHQVMAKFADRVFMTKETSSGIPITKLTIHLDNTFDYESFGSAKSGGQWFAGVQDAAVAQSAALLMIPAPLDFQKFAINVNMIYVDDNTLKIVTSNNETLTYAPWTPPPGLSIDDTILSIITGGTYTNSAANQDSNGGLPYSKMTMNKDGTYDAVINATGASESGQWRCANVDFSAPIDRVISFYPANVSVAKHVISITFGTPLIFTEGSTSASFYQKF